MNDANINASIYRALKYNRKKCRWLKLFNYTLNDLRKHLEKQFTKEMNWDNYGSYWRIDKIIPSSFYRNIEIVKCWNLKNLRPMKKIDCLQKRGKIIKSLVDKYNLYDILPLGFIKFDQKEGL